MPKRPLPAPGEIGVCYLIHLSEPIAHANHYLGWTKNVSARCRHHLNGNGSKLLAAASQRGIDFQVVRTWEKADRRFERRLKNTANAANLCPVCNPGSWKTQMPAVGEPRRSPQKGGHQ